MFHLNAQSLPAKFENIENYLDSIDHKFSVCAFSETWFHDDVPSLYNMSNYSFISKSRTGRKGGGVCMYVKSNIVHKRRNDLTLDNDHIDSLFIEIIQKRSKKCDNWCHL